MVFDLPPVTEVARDFIVSHGLSGRITTVGGDFTADALPAGADVVIMASNLPQYSREIIQRVVRKASRDFEQDGVRCLPARQFLAALV